MNPMANSPCESCQREKECKYIRKGELTPSEYCHAYRKKRPGAVDNVNHPAHYETGRFECIDVMGEALGIENQKGFCLCNAFKYLYRCTKKHSSPVEDVKKAVWYLNKFLELEGEK